MNGERRSFALLQPVNGVNAQDRIARWREDVLLEGGSIGRILRSVVLGSVSELPTRAEAQARLEEQLLRWLSAHSQQRRETLVFPTLKLSTQHGYKNLLRRLTTGAHERPSTS